MRPDTLSLSVLEWHRQSWILRNLHISNTFWLPLCFQTNLRCVAITHFFYSKLFAQWLIFFGKLHVWSYIIYDHVLHIYDKDRKIWKEVYRRSRSPPQGSSFYGFPRSWAVISQSGRTPFFVFVGDDDVKQSCLTCSLSSLISKLSQNFILKTHILCFCDICDKMQ